MKEKHSILTEDFECVDPEVGEQYLHGYVADSLSNEQRQDFDDHLVFCHKCQEDLEYLRWATQQVKTHWTPTGEGALTPLPVTALVDGNLQDLLHDYYEKPLGEQLAAAAETTAELAFPITMEYANGEIIGQFLKRAGHLFFRLKKSSDTCTLVYTSISESKTFVLREGDDKRLGRFNEFVTTNTIQGMVTAIKQFQLLLKRKEE
jgi:hypothetical protein